MADRQAKPHLLGDHLAFDFLNSRVGPVGGRGEWLENGEGLLKWLTEAGAIPAAVGRQFRRRQNAAAELDAVATQARKLRDWLGAFVSRHAGRVVDAEVLVELGSLNRLLARDDTFRQIALAATPSHGEEPTPFQLHQVRRWTVPDRLLQPIAESIGELICTADFRLVKVCEGEGCILTFYDRTKAHARRWCSMALCGNRAKAAAHRARNREPPWDGH